MKCVNCGAKVISYSRSTYQQTSSGNACPFCHKNTDFSLSGEKLFEFWMAIFLFVLFVLSLLWAGNAFNYTNLKGSFFVPLNDYRTTTGYVKRTDIVKTYSRGKAYYIAKIYYLYKVDDIIYESNQVHFQGWQSRKPEVMAKLVDKYSERASVTVYYKNNEPDFSVLEPSVKLDAKWVFKYYGPVFLLGVLAVFWSYFQFRKVKKIAPV